MEASTIWSALTASVLAGVPTLSTHYLAFSTEVIDLTDHVQDLLSLLLEVRIGGGTHIAAGLRHARSLITVPSRTLVVVVSDFEEGYPLGGLLAEVRDLVGSGCHVLGCASPDDSGRPRYSTGVADRTVRLGDTALTHRELSRAGLALSGATVSPTGRLGAGAGVRAVRAAGAGWTEEPLARLWSAPAADQAARALESRSVPGGGAGGDLLFLDITVVGAVGAVGEAGGDCLPADCESLAVRVAAAHDHPALAHRDNLRLLAARPGLRLRITGRLDPAPTPACSCWRPPTPPTRAAARAIGLDRLQRADLPASAPDASDLPDVPQTTASATEQAASASRRVLAFPGTTARADTHRLRRSGLTTAADRSRDPFGRLLPADTGRFAQAWLSAAVYGDAVEQALCLAAWQRPAGSEPVVSAGR